MKSLVLLWFICGSLLHLNADTLVVVAGESFRVNSLEIEEIRSLYLAKKFRLGNQKILPLNLGIDNPLRYLFEENVLNEDRDTLTYVWLKAHYLGHRAPKVFKSQEAVAEFLSKVDNSVGYVEEEIAQKYHLKILFRAKE
ncbi:MAG: hypothetical protein ACXWB0_07975 [Sulfuricurvum sp.]